MLSKFREVRKYKSYQTVFGTHEGKKVLHDLMYQHHVVGTTFAKDPQEMALNEGERNVVLRIMSILKMDTTKLEKFIENSEVEEGADYAEF